MDKNKAISALAVSFRQGFVSPNIPIASFKQGDKDIILLLDSGSDKNVIDATAVSQFKYEIKNQDEGATTHLTGVGGTQKVEICTLSFDCGDENYTTDFLITDLSSAFGAIKAAHCIEIHGILGSEFLREHNITLDFKNLSAYSRE